MDDQPTDDIQQIPSHTPDFQAELAQKLQELVPEAITDGKIDTQKLKELLDTDVADDSERFGLFWPGKKRAMRAAQEPTTATLKPAKDESKDWDTTENIFIEGDNLEVLKILQKYYHNKIKMIYIDPPYNTGKDFVYPDNYKEGLASYLEFTKQVDKEGRKVSTNSDTDGRYHSNWLNMMYPRLKLARNLLTDDGLIFMSIDDNEANHLRSLANEIFGSSNFIGVFVWKRRSGAMDASTNLSEDHDYVLAYSRKSGELNGVERTFEKYANPDNDPRGPWIADNLTAGKPGGDTYYPIVDPRTGNEYLPPQGRYWPYSRETMAKKIKEDRVIFPNSPQGSPKLKRFANEAQKETLPVSSVIESPGGRATQSNLITPMNSVATKALSDLLGAKYFSFPKPVELLVNLLRQGTGSESIVLDFFSGSGTTAHAVMQLNAEDGGNRKHIQVQLPEPTEEKSEAHKAGFKTISDISKERIRRAGEKIKVDYADKLAKRNSPLDVGFKVFRLADSNFTKWRSDSATDKDSLQQHLLDIRESSNDAASEEELLTEVLLKQGISLTAPLKHTNVLGLSTWVVGDNVVAAYLDEHIKPSLDQLRAVVAAEPAKLIILEDAFHGDDELKTNLVQICKTQKIELWTV